MSDDPNAAGNLKLRGASATKPPIGIVPMHPLVGVARVLEDSATHYAPFNYMAQPVLDALEAYDSAELRHRLASTLLGGQVTPESYAALDPDSGIPHIYHRIAGLLILASLMIRDGMLAADPGMGKRKRASFGAAKAEATPIAVRLAAREMERAASFHMATTPGDAPSDLAGLAAREAVPSVPRVSKAIGEPGGWYTCQEHQSDTCVHAPDDPDAARRAAADAHLEQLKRDQVAQSEQRRRWENRCMPCNGTGQIAHDPDERGTCYKCNGTGQRTGAEGVSW